MKERGFRAGYLAQDDQLVNKRRAAVALLVGRRFGRA